jgi:hypothetical protein
MESLQIPCHPAQKRQAIVPQESTRSDLGAGAPNRRKAAIIRTASVRINSDRFAWS